ncbi:MAG: hypothetical protein ACRDWI_11260 [Jiangellaceae bacterium]
MNPVGRPDAARRFVRRPLWWVVIVAGATAWIFLDDLVSSSRVDQAFDDGPRAVADVDADYDGGAEVPVAFEHPMRQERIRAVMALSDIDRAPEPEAQVPIEISVDDPTRVTLVGDRHRATDSVGFELGLVALPLVFFLGRAIGVRRSERLMTAAGPSYSMTGVLRSTGRLRPHVAVDLFPLDAPAGGAALASVALLSTGGVPLERSYPVEVKGSPRPLGAVVARVADGTVLWPRGRASWRTGSTWSVWPSTTRSTGPGPAPTGVLPARSAPAALPAPTWPPPWRSVPPLLALALGGSVLLGSLVSVTTMLNGRIAARADRSDVLVLGRVVDGGLAFGEVVVDYRLPDDIEARRVVVALDDPDLHPEGTTVALRVDPSDPDNIRVASEPYDAAEPQVWAWLPAFAAAIVFVSWLSVTRRNRRVARRGWHPVDSWRVTNANTVALAVPDAPTASCVARVLEGYASRWPPALTGSREILVAGTMAPGDPIALRIDDRAVPAVWVAEAPTEPSSVERPGGQAHRSAA